MAKSVGGKNHGPMEPVTVSQPAVGLILQGSKATNQQAKNAKHTEIRGKPPTGALHRIRLQARNRIQKLTHLSAREKLRRANASTSRRVDGSIPGAGLRRRGSASSPWRWPSAWPSCRGSLARTWLVFGQRIVFAWPVVEQGCGWINSRISSQRCEQVRD